MKEKQEKLKEYGFKEKIKNPSKFKDLIRSYSTTNNEKNYSTSLVKEKSLFIEIMNDLVESIDIKENKGRGRPTHFKDLLKTCIMKVYLKSPARQLDTELNELQTIGIIKTIPTFNTINNFLNNKNIQQLLEGLITDSSLPLKHLETHFAIDASGISSYKFSRWLNLRNVTLEKKNFI